MFSAAVIIRPTIPLGKRSVQLKSRFSCIPPLPVGGKATGVGGGVGEATGGNGGDVGTGVMIQGGPDVGVAGGVSVALGGVGVAVAIGVPGGGAVTVGVLV